VFGCRPPYASGEGEMRSDKIVLVLCLCSFMLVAYTAPKTKIKLPSKYVIKNITTGVDAQYDSPLTRDLCSKFTMQESEVRLFFKKADVISAHIREHGFDWLPCYVRGDMVVHGKAATWEIESSKTGWIKYADGTMRYLGCKEECAELFRNK
jgi:hypothetical protein